jgi:hypothetical protein
MFRREEDTMSRKMFGAILVAFFGLAASRAVAWEALSCSPGFWKTHLLGPAGELCALGSPSAPDTFTFDCAGTAGATLECGAGPGLCTCEELVAFLSLQGGGENAVSRFEAAACLNVVAQDQLGGVTIVCEELPAQ